MPRQKSILTVIRDLVRQEVSRAMGTLLAGLSSSGKPGPKAARGGRRAGPGRPPGKRGPGRPKGSKNKPKPEA